MTLLADSDRSYYKAYITGITSNVSTVELTMPPIIGAAMRFIMSAPVPVVHMIGSKPPLMAATVIILGRTRTMLLTAVKAPLARHLEKMKRQHQYDLERGSRPCCPADCIGSGASPGEPRVGLAVGLPNLEALHPSGDV